ncbi:MAG: RluA family pseudouridine synthase [Ruminococcaceae bacterium]|nr:RluA family pseudouridine synthase [Oscillospiraceae bacterium]
MRKLTYIVPPDKDGICVGRFLRGHCQVSSRMVTKLKRVPNGITMDSVHIRTIDPVRAGGEIVLILPEDERPALSTDIPIDVVFEDDDVIIIDKQAGLPVHPTRGHFDDTLANAYAAHLEKRGEKGTFRPINRLDRDTTGLLLACKNAYSCSRLHGHFDKRYYAVCQGELEGSGTIDAPIRRCAEPGIKREVGEGGQRAVTHWKAVYSRDGLTLLEIELGTGRTHQIRTHFSCCMNMPLIGDDMYGGSTDIIKTQALHCAVLGFTHPVTDERVCFSSDKFSALYILGDDFVSAYLAAVKEAEEIIKNKA